MGNSKNDKLHLVEVANQKNMLRQSHVHHDYWDKIIEL